MSEPDIAAASVLAGIIGDLSNATEEMANCQLLFIVNQHHMQEAILAKLEKSIFKMEQALKTTKLLLKSRKRRLAKAKRG